MLCGRQCCRSWLLNVYSFFPLLHVLTDYFVPKTNKQKHTKRSVDSGRSTCVCVLKAADSSVAGQKMRALSSISGKSRAAEAPEISCGESPGKGSRASFPFPTPAKPQHPGMMPFPFSATQRSKVWRLTSPSIIIKEGKTVDLAHFCGLPQRPNLSNSSEASEKRASGVLLPPFISWLIHSAFNLASSPIYVCWREGGLGLKAQKLEPIIQSEVSQKEKHQYSILTHIYGI